MPEDGIVHHDHFQGLLKHIWGEVMKPDPIPMVVGPDEIGHLQARLRGKERREKRCYYIAIPAEPSHPLRMDKMILTRLQEALQFYALSI